MAKLMSIFPEKSSFEIVFESEKHYDLFCALFPSQKERAHTAASLIATQTSVDVGTSQERLSCLLEFLENEEQRDSAKYLKTLEQLRLSLIVTPDQVDFCFSQLYPTPKNTRLKALLHHYLSSPLKKDMAQCYWEAIGHLKEKTLPSLNLQRIFVKAKSSSFLFSEWALAHQTLQEGSCSPIEFWELTQSTPQTTSDFKPALVGNPANILSKLAQEVASHREEGGKQLIAFGGAPHALLFLESKLKSLKVSFESLFSHRKETQT
ncbi:MAG: hypothetical protein ACKOA8_03425, partial [Deltaproteobacteria bacterium]